MNSADSISKIFMPFLFLLLFCNLSPKFIILLIKKNLTAFQTCLRRNIKKMFTMIRNSIDYFESSNYDQFIFSFLILISPISSYFFFIIQRVKARAISCPHQPPSRGDNTVSVAQGGTATPGATQQLLPLDRVWRESYIYIYIYIRQIN